MPMKIFILEDDPARQMAFVKAILEGKHILTMADSVPKAKAQWNPPYDIVCLDHDLGGQQMVKSDEENTGFQFCRFLTEPEPFASCAGTWFVVHSYNPDGASAMVALLADHYDTVLRQPFGPQLLLWLQLNTSVGVHNGQGA